MEFEFFGGACEVGKQCLRISYKKTNLLIDCGIHPSKHVGPEIDNHYLKNIDCIIITHAHNDHWGFLFNLLNHPDFIPEIYMTRPTADILENFGFDDQKRYNPEFYKEEIYHKYNKLLRYGKYGEWITNGDITFCFLPSSHILGSAQVLINLGNKQILFTSDINPNGSYLLKPINLEEFEKEYNLFIHPEIVFMESTHGKKNDIKKNKEELENELIDKLQNTISMSGNILIPSFSIGRTQEFLAQYMILASKNPEIIPYKIIVLGRTNKINDLYESYYGKYHMIKPDSNLLSKYPIINFSKLVNIQFNNDKYKAIDELMNKNQYIFIATGGMLYGLAFMVFSKLKDSFLNKVIFIGYLKEGTNGYKLLENQTNDKNKEDLYYSMKNFDIIERDKLEEISIEEWENYKPLSFECNIDKFSYKYAHGDHKDLLNYAKTLIDRGATIFFLHHGDISSSKELGQEIKNLDNNITVKIPKNKQKFIIRR